MGFWENDINLGDIVDQVSKLIPDFSGLFAGRGGEKVIVNVTSPI